MRIIHTSDIHIDSPMSARLSPAEQTVRRRELLSTFRRIIDTAVRDEYAAVIIAGDLFDNERVGIRTLDSVIGAIEAAKSVSFLYLPGNHEKQRLISSGLSLPENLKIFGEDWTYFNIDGVTFAGRSTIAENMFDSLVLDSAMLNVAVLHGELAQHTDSVSKIGISELERCPIDYLALGHYHTFSQTKIGTRTLAAYSGTPEGRGFDETGEKGYASVELSEFGVRCVFVRAASRLMQIKEVDISGASRELEIEERVAAALSELSSRDLVRVVLTGEHTPEMSRNTEALKERFAPRFYCLEVKDESKLRISPEEYKNDKSLKGEFIRLVLACEELSEEDKADIIECGIRALAGETA